jgi:HlyD family secretion protein
MKNSLIKIKNYIKNHKVISVAILIVLAFSTYLIFKKINSAQAETEYIISKVEKGNIISSITGSGQISSSSQIDLKPKVSGEIIYLNVKNGQKINKGTLIAKLDTTEISKDIRDAEINLANAKISFSKTQIENSENNLNKDLNETYENGFNTVSSAFLDMPSIITDLEDILNSQNLSDNAARINGKTAQKYREEAENLFYKAKNNLNTNQKTYRNLNLNSSKIEIENLISETYETSKILSEAIKSMKNFVDYQADSVDNSSEYSSSQETLVDNTNTNNNHLSNLLSLKKEISEYENTFTNADLDIQSAELSLRQKEISLQDLKEELNNYYLRAPFSGTIASLNMQKGDMASSSSALASVISEEKIAEVTLNEVDIAKVKIGQKTTLTFDAISDLIILGEVIEVDSIGTVSSGVVNYTIKISLDTQDERIKPGMTISTTIIIEKKENVFLLPSSAIKNKNENNYVEVFNDSLLLNDGRSNTISGKNKPEQKIIQIGISDDTKTEIISGLNEEDVIVIKTIKSNTKTSTTNSNTKATSASSLLSGSGPMMSGNRPPGN